MVAETVVERGKVKLLFVNRDSFANHEHKKQASFSNAMRAMKDLAIVTNFNLTSLDVSTRCRCERMN